MSRNADMMRVAGYVWEKFSICTYNPLRLAEFARDILATNPRFTVAQLALRESLERVARW